MSYTALYRKFRPNNFGDVKGQEHIVETLRNQIKAERIGHAYLFCGTRGTGKTTVAKIFAKAVNCEHPQDGSPCGECSVCQAIQAQNSLNVIEIDAASNNGVDNIREIREEVAYSPTEGKYKVYIIDEVHMLSIGAFNALLKTLEEPPSYVIFILATTEAHKIPVTILSRCQRYDFRRITMDTIADRLLDLMRLEGQETEERAIRYIAKAADGSMRDALSLLDQCISFYLGQCLTYDKVLEILGAVDTEVFADMLSLVMERNVLSLMQHLEELVMQGRELSQFVVDFTWYLRNLMLLQGSDQMEEILDVSTEQIGRLKEQAAQIEPEVLIRYIRVFSDLSNQLKYASQKRILIEVALIKLCKPEMSQDYSAICERISILEQRIEAQSAVTPELLENLKKEIQQSATLASPSQTASEGAGPMKNTVAPVLPKAIPEEVQKIAENWNQVVAQTDRLARAYIKDAHLTLGGDNRLTLVFDQPMAVEYYHREEHKKELETIIGQVSGKTVEVDIRANETGQPAERIYPDICKLVNMDIEFE
ncbi:MAG: DNA polymerase III subunit gamma/tau [Lachnospiraceae bacterium]|nr:DNA polymerase III subunit gamma/tau [Lachnospiraceae bacterium]